MVLIINCTNLYHKPPVMEKTNHIYGFYKAILLLGMIRFCFLTSRTNESRLPQNCILLFKRIFICVYYIYIYIYIVLQDRTELINVYPKTYFLQILKCVRADIAFE